MAWPVPWAVEYVLSHAPRRSSGATSDRLAAATGPKMAVALPWRNRSTTRSARLETAKYVSGIEAKTREPASSRRRRPKRSDNAPAGSLRNTPVIVDAAMTKPTSAGPAPSSCAKRGSRGTRQIE